MEGIILGNWVKSVTVLLSIDNDDILLLLLLFGID